MNETQKRIKAYKEALPHLKERVAAVALLLVISIAMMTSASFAWLTISRSPELTGVNTTVAANGNLEIALATGDGKTAPGESQVGDSSAAEGQSVTGANITWGNLINLSDPSYGLENLVLRPAQLNTTALLTSPLYGAVYSEDGRVTRLTSNFSYTSWIPPEGVVEGYFGLSTSLGVRAVSSTKREVAGFYGTYLDMKDKAVGDNTTAGNTFAAIAQNDEWMTVLAKLMGIHMTATLNYEDQYVNAVVSDEDLETLIAMYDAFIQAHEQEAEALAKQLNLQLYAAYGGGAYTAWNAEAILELAANDYRMVKTADAAKGLEVGDFAYDITIEKEGQPPVTKTIKISQLQTFIKDYNMLVADVAEIGKIKDGDDGRWDASGLKDIINKLVKIDDCLVKKTSDSSYKTVKALLTEFSSGISGYTTAMGYMNSNCDVVITNGVFKNFEQRTGGSITIQKLPVTATMYVNTMNIGEVSATIYANITTSATDPADFLQDNDHADSLNTGADNDAGTVMAQDTYALAVDLWVRTNAQGSYLTLEGNVLTEEAVVDATGKDANGNTVQLYVLNRSKTVPAENGTSTLVTENYTLYQLPVGENETKPTVWYDKDDGTYIALYEGDAPGKSGETVTVGGVEYDVYTLTRNEDRYREDTYELYKVDTTWYNAADGTVFELGDGEVPVESDKTGDNGKIYTLTRVTTYQESVSYELYQKQIDVIWYNAETYGVFYLNDGETPTQKKETIYTVIGYEGENRVWNGEDKSYITADSTTQGSGSCYVYYADTPEDQARSLELLAAMNVAFIDGKGALLAVAEMDTEQFFAEGGRVTVPLKLTSGVVLGEREDGSIIYGITGLEKNTPTRITALVFLDGTLLGNENVLAASDIQGRLNIQFGSSQDLNPIDNEDLEGDELRVSASVSNTGFDYDTYVGDMRTTVTVNVDGDQPNTVTGFFTRQISSTQGSREQEMTFTKNADGTWTADYTFDSPGVYVLRSVRLDGVDYDLATMPTVTITGFNVASLTMSGTGVEGSHANIMTADNSSTVDLSLQFATDDPDKMPATVQGRFLREDGTAVNVNFNYNPVNNTWNGSATFLSSGDYTFQYLVLDGEYTALDESLHKTATVTLGMKVAVYTTSPVSFKYLESEMTDNQKVLGMQVKIMDNTGKEMEGLTGAWLYYYMPGASGDGLATALTWDAPSGYYTGELLTLESGGPGTWQFSHVTVGGNTLTNATTSPIFELISPEPPSYEGIPTKTSYQFRTDGKATMEVALNYSATARVFAVINGIEVEGVRGATSGNATTWYFTIPKTNTYANDTQDGHWTMEEVRIWNYYTAAGDYIAYEKEDGTRDEPMVIDMTGENYTTKVVQTVKVTFAANQSKDFGKDANGNITGSFMDTHTISGLTVKIEDFEGALKDVSDVQIAYAYGGDSVAKGGYSGSTIPASGVTVFTVMMNPDQNGTTFTQSADETVRFAGTYTPAFSFKVGGTTMYINSAGVVTAGEVPAFTVWSVTPTLGIDSISPSGTHSAVRQGSGAFGVPIVESTTATSGINGNTITIYCEATRANRYEATIGRKPQVTLRLNGAGNASEVTLEFFRSGGGTVGLYSGDNGSGQTNAFVWKENESTCMRYVGSYSKDCANSTPAGTITSSDSIVLKYIEESFTVEVDPITIINNGT